MYWQPLFVWNILSVKPLMVSWASILSTVVEYRHKQLKYILGTIPFFITMGSPICCPSTFQNVNIGWSAYCSKTMAFVSPLPSNIITAKNVGFFIVIMFSGYICKGMETFSDSGCEWNVFFDAGGRK